MSFRWTSAGESHGPGILAIVEGLPSGIPLDPAFVDRFLARRQRGYGRGGRMRIEEDRVEILSGLRGGRTLGTPLSMLVRNRDATLERLPPLTRPRPGHGDLAGMLKFDTTDARDILERASARSTVAAVCAGAAARALLERCGIVVEGFCLSIGSVEAQDVPVDLHDLVAARDGSDFLCPDPSVDAAMRAAVDAAKEAGDTLGGLVEVRATGVPAGLGDHRASCDRLDARLAAALMGIPAIKGVEIGLGFAAARLPGSRVHDAILPGEGGAPRRGGNHAGGLEAGIANGEPIVIRGAMKPLSSLRRPLPSVDVVTGEAAVANTQRSDTCAVPAASVVAEAVVTLELVRSLLEKTGGDTLEEVIERLDTHRRRVAARFPRIR